MKNLNSLNPMLGVWPTIDGIAIGRSHCYAHYISSDEITGAKIPQKYPFTVDNELINQCDLDRRPLAFTLFGGDKDAISRVREARVAIIGLGGVGTATCTSLCKLGFQDFAIFDDDDIEPSNTYKSMVFTETNITQKKITAIQEWLESNGSLVKTFETKLERNNSCELLNQLASYDPNIVVWTGDSDELHALSNLSKQLYHNKTKPIIITGGIAETCVIVGPSLREAHIDTLEGWITKSEETSSKKPACRSSTINPGLITHVTIAGSLIANEALLSILNPNALTPLFLSRFEIDLLTLEVTYHTGQKD